MLAKTHYVRFLKFPLVSFAILLFISCSSSSKEERQLKKTINVYFSQNNIPARGLEISPIDSAYVNPFEKEDFIALCKEYRETERKYFEYRATLIGLESELQRLEDCVSRQNNSISKMNSQLESEKLKSDLHALSWLFGISGKSFIANTLEMIEDYATQEILNERINNTRGIMQQTKLQIDSCYYAIDALTSVYQATKVKKFAARNEILQKADKYKNQYCGKSVIVSYRNKKFCPKYYVVLQEDLAKVIQVKEISESNKIEEEARTIFSELKNAEEVLTDSYDWHPDGGGLNEDEQKSIFKFIKAVELGNRDFVASSIHYPINRIYPLPSIDNKKEFLRYYDSYFSQDIISSIFNKTWARVGWRGIMCDYGIFWGEIEEDGVFRINRFKPTPKDLAEKELLFGQQKKQLHPSVADFKEQVIAIKTAKFKIRIDKLDDGKMRYAAWRISDDFSAKPSLVIRGGEYWTEGSIGYPYYMFKTEDYTYLISDSGKLEYDYELNVFKGNSLTKENYLHEDAILSEKAYIIK